MFSAFPKGVVRNSHRGQGEVGILNLGSEMRWPILAMGMEFANPPLELDLKYHEPLPLV